MNIKELKELIAHLPDDALVLQETGDHSLYEAYISASNAYQDPKYGLIEAYLVNDNSKPALIVR